MYVELVGRMFRPAGAKRRLNGIVRRNLFWLSMSNGRD
jgi:hypothetical protein